MLKRLLTILGLSLALSGPALAIPMNFHGTVTGPQANYTLLHSCATPSGCPGFRDWFAAGQSISGVIDLDAGTIITHGNSYSTLAGHVFDMYSLYVSFDTNTGRVISGEMDYGYRGQEGTITFADVGMGHWNSITLPDMNRNFGGFLWGGDPSWSVPGVNGVGIDYVFTAKIPEPGTLGLMGLGLLGLAFAVRRKRHV